MQRPQHRGPTGRAALFAAVLVTACGFPDYGFDATRGEPTASTTGGVTGPTGGDGGSDSVSAASSGGSSTACESVEDCPPLPNAQVACFGGGCGVDVCADGFANCDDVASTGCEAILASSPLHCGGCGARCSNAHGETTCSAGVCIPACAPGWDSCDGNPNNGCETAISTVQSCGGCDLVCDFPNAGATCEAGSCARGPCADGWGDCDGADANGCETDLRTSHTSCGACGNGCEADELCSASACDEDCAPGTANCDGEMANGCEIDSDVDARHCGSCGTSCDEDEVCAGGSCDGCPSGMRDCDLDGADGCETDTTQSPLSCGGCSTICGSDGTCGCSGGSCTGGVIHFSEDFSDNARGWALEGEWEIGAAMPSVGQRRGYGDPASDHSASGDGGLAGVVIGGNYSSQVHDAEYLTSPAIDLSAASGSVHLTYWRHLNADRDPLTTQRVEVWDGSGWITVWSNISGNDPVEESAWTRRSHDVTPHKNAAFRVRFGHRTKKQGSKLPEVMSGWNVDDVSLSSGACE